MSEPKKPAASKITKTKSVKAIADVAHPGKSAPSDTSKPIITQRPIMKDPMMLEDSDDKSKDTAKEPLSKKSTAPDVAPTDVSKETPADTTPETQPKEAKADAEEITDNETPADPDKADKDDTDTGKKPKKPEEAVAVAQAEQDTKLEKIIDSKKYFLPINAVEQRRSKHFVVLGVLLAVVLAVAWADVALDAGLVHLGSVKPLTHFFSN